MPASVVNHDRLRVPLRLTSFYELYKRLLKEHGCRWHDVAKLLNVVAEILFDGDDPCTKLAGKVSLNREYSFANTNFSFSTKEWPNAFL